jgi:hypothetical protein
MAAIKKRGFPFRAKDFLFLPEPFGIEEENILDFSIVSSDEVVPASTAVENFCREKGAAKKETMMLALFVEELCNNIIKFSSSMVSFYTLLW